MTAYAYDAWYPLAWSRDIGHSLTTRRVLEQDLVVYRTQGGWVVALEDVCPHRLAPLSLGTLKDDTVECGYHGLRFDCSGQCVEAPGMLRPPTGAAVRSYPTEESMGRSGSGWATPRAPTAARSCACRPTKIRITAWSKAMRCGCRPTT